MEKKRQKIWTAIGVGIAIALLLYWLTLAIWIDDDTDPPMPPPVEETSIQVCFIIETGKETALLREKEAKRRFRRAKISGLEELIYTIIFLFFVCFIGIILSFVYSCNKHYPLSCF